MITSVVTSPPLSYGPTRADAMVASSARQGTEGGGERTDAFKFHVTVFQVPRQQIEKKIDIFFSKKKCAGTKYFFFASIGFAKNSSTSPTWYTLYIRGSPTREDEKKKS